MADRTEFRVLLVELEGEMLRVLCPSLRNAGYAAACASDEAAALAKAGQWQPAVIIIDLGTLTGPTTAARIRQQAGWRRPFVLGLTEPNDRAAHQRAEEVGVDLLVLKPLQIERVLGVLERFARVLADTAAFDPMI